MEGRENGDRFPELFGLIEEYADGGGEREAMALKVIGGAYLPSLESRGLGDAGGAKRVVDSILERHGYFVEHGKSGGLHPQSVHAVLNVAKHSGKEEDRRWGASRLFRMMEALGRKAGAGEGYPKHAADAALLSASLTQLVNAARASRANVGSLN
jgi:hypothetical protein